MRIEQFIFEELPNAKKNNDIERVKILESIIHEVLTLTTERNHIIAKKETIKEVLFAKCKLIEDQYYRSKNKEKELYKKKLKIIYYYLVRNVSFKELIDYQRRRIKNNEVELKILIKLKRLKKTLF